MQTGLLNGDFQKASLRAPWVHLPVAHPVVMLGLLLLPPGAANDHVLLPDHLPQHLGREQWFLLIPVLTIF